MPQCGNLRLPQYVKSATLGPRNKKATIGDKQALIEALPGMPAQNAVGKQPKQDSICTPQLASRVGYSCLFVPLCRVQISRYCYTHYQ